MPDQNSADNYMSGYRFTDTLLYTEIGFCTLSFICYYTYIYIYGLIWHVFRWKKKAFQ